MSKQFIDGMSWENHGYWHMDHIRPCNSFDFTKEEEIFMCFHYTNYQPLWAFDNISKSDKYDEETFHRVWKGTEWVNKK